MKSKQYAINHTITSDEVRTIRKQMHMTQKEFAEFLGCSKPTVERMEKKDDVVEGPVAVFLNLLLSNRELLVSYEVPDKTFPVRMWYMYKSQKCTLIDVNEMTEQVKIKNYVQNHMFKAFGANENPTYEEYQDFLESRCFPKSRDKMKLVLKDLGLPFYDPYMIIKKTQGRMAEDDFWIMME